MKKKDLLELDAVPNYFVPEHNRQIFQIMFAITGRALKKQKILEIDGYDNCTGELMFRHFTGKDDYCTWDVKKRKWDRNGLSILNGSNSYPGNVIKYEDPKLLTMAQKLFGKEKIYRAYSRVVDYIEDHEQLIRERKQHNTETRKEKQIRKIMYRYVPNLPDRFKQWCIRQYRNQKKEWMGTRFSVKLFQPVKEGGNIERMFWLTGTEKDGYCLTEICRAFTDYYGGTWQAYYYGCKWQEAGRGQTFWAQKNRSIVSVLPKRYVVYDNLDDLDMTPAQRSTLRILSGKADPSRVLWNLKKTPELEAVAKTGLTRCATQITVGQNVGALKKATKEQLNLLRKYNGGLESLHFLLDFPNITEENFKEVCGIRSEMKLQTIREAAGLVPNINHLFILWRKTGGIKEPTILKYMDYLKMARQQGKDTSDEIIYRDKKWRRRHDDYLEEINRRRQQEEEKRQKAKLRRYRKIAADYSRNVRLFQWEHDGFMIMVPRDAAAINEEGRLQHHCVGAQDGYKEKMCNRKSWIVFLRKATDPDTPYYTIEVSRDRICQFYAAYDRQPDKDAVEAILSEWMKQVRKNFAAVEAEEAMAKGVTA